MVAEPWLLKMGNQVSSNLKHALLLEPYKTRNRRKPEAKEKEIVGILSFEVANVMSKTVLLFKSLSDSEISKLKSEIFNSQGVKNLVSSDENFLLELALAEKLDDLNRVAGVVSRLGKKCTEPALQGFEHVYGDIMSGVIDVKELGFLVKDMEGMVRKMERYVSATVNLYSELEVLNELEQAVKKFQQNQHEESRKAFEQKLIWQKQEVRHLKEISIWSQTYDKVVELLARTVCTIFAKICAVFGDSALRTRHLEGGSSPMKNDYGPVSGEIGECTQVQVVSGPLRRILSRSNSGCQLGSIERPAVVRKGKILKSHVGLQRGETAFFQHEDYNFPCGTSPGRLIMDCLSLSSSVSRFDDADNVDREGKDRNSQISRCSGVTNGGFRSEHPNHADCFSPTKLGVSFNAYPKQAKNNVLSSTCFGPNSRLTVYAPPSTVGGSALALHYANVIIVIEKLLRYPHLVGEDARDDLYQMLPTSLRKTLRTNLKAYFKNFVIYDAPLALDWKETLDKRLWWLAPLAHNMIRWQSERNFEQQQIVKRTNVLLLQTLYFADRGKTEAAICELLVGLNYICRYEQQQNALLDCTSSIDFDDCMEWQSQDRASYLN
ncbi:protein PSK SIMULATOR 1-like [Tripterygium wilfordii]|uniref:protein PSK SIMULATOR 1-like n=1 Tax=Tripterygium wilfordii TaxID=458696 RepID=UPI0018F8525E|nr:protein PSK SIMULATOR 1-like [Tripterygium wilfordii]